MNPETRAEAIKIIEREYSLDRQDRLLAILKSFEYEGGENGQRNNKKFCES